MNSNKQFFAQTDSPCVQNPNGYQSNQGPLTYAYGQPMQQNNWNAYPPAGPPPSNDYGCNPVEGELLYGGSQNPHLRRFVKTGWKDVWAAVLFYIVFLGTIVWGIYNAITFEHTFNSTAGDEIEFDIEYSYGALAGIICLAFAVSIAFGLIGIFLMTCFPKGMIYIANIFSIICWIALTIFFFLYSVLLGFIFGIFALLHIVWFFLVRQRIPFAAETLRAATRVIWTYKSIFLFQLLLILMLVGYSIMWSFVLIRPLDNLNALETEDTPWYDVVTILVFVLIFFWVMQVLPNVMSVTAAGLTATWYFVGMNNMPENPTLMSFKRAVTTSFGSICFGSLIVAVIQFLRYLAESSSRRGNGNLLTCCCICMLRCLESLVKIFNTYAYVHIAMYGYDYITAAKHTFELMQQCVCAALINNCLINPTLNLLIVIFSVVIGVVLGFSFASVVIGILAFLISVLVHNLMYSSISIAATTIFVCFAEVPEALLGSDPALYRVFVETDNNGTGNNAQSR